MSKFWARVQASAPTSALAGWWMVCGQKTLFHCISVPQLTIAVSYLLTMHLSTYLVVVVVVVVIGR